MRVQFLILFLFSILSCRQMRDDFGNTEELAGIEQNVIENNLLRASIPKKKPINWIGYWKGEGKRETLLYKIMDEFSFLNQDIQINMKFEQDIDEIQQIDDVYFKKVPRYIADMIRSNDYKWDVVPLIGDAYTYVAEALGDPDWGHKYLVDFKNVPGFLETQKGFIVENNSYRQRTDGIFIGPSIEGYYYALYYNQDLTQKIGLQINKFDMTYEDLLSYIKIIYEYNNLHGTQIAAFYEASDWITIANLFQHLIKSELEYSAEYKTPFYFTSFHQKALKKTLKAFEELAKYDPLISSVDDNLWGETKHLVLEDQAVFYVNGTWMYNNWETIDEEKVNKMIPAELPVFKPVKYYMGGYASNFAVFKHSPNREKAVKLLMHWTRKDAVDDWIRYSKSPSGTTGHIKTAGFGGDVHETFVHSIGEKYGQNIGTYESNLDYIFGRNCGVQFTEFSESLHFILKQQKTAEEVFRYLSSRIR